MIVQFNYPRVTTSYPEEKRTVIARQDEVQDLWDIVKVSSFDLNREKTKMEMG